MKKTLLFIAGMICLSSISQAQITKGSFFLGGSLGYSGSSNKQGTPQTPLTQENSSYSWSFTPQVGKVVADNQVVGIFLDFGKFNSEQKSGNNSTVAESNNNGGGVFYRRYFPFSQRFFIFGDAGLGVGFGKSENLSDDGTRSYVSSKGNSTQVKLAITPGLSFAATRKLFLEASFNNLLSFVYSSSEGETYNSQGTVLSTGENNSFSASANANGFSNLSIGLRWILPTKK